MDPRLSALIEVRNLLENEGWPSDETDGGSKGVEPHRKAVVRPNTILAVVCLAAVTTNFILVGANHDLRQRGEARITVTGVRIEEELFSVSREKKKSGLFITLDGQKIWEGMPGTGGIWDRIDGVPSSPSASLEVKGLLQLWGDFDGDPTLIGQSIIDADHPDGSIIEVEIIPRTHLILYKHLYVLLKIDNSRTSAVASTRSTTRE